MPTLFAAAGVREITNLLVRSGLNKARPGRTNMCTQFRLRKLFAPNNDEARRKVDILT